MVKSEPAKRDDMRKYLKLSVILFIAIAVRLACFFYYQAHLGIKTFEYEEVAVNLIQGRGFTFEFLGTVYRAGIAPVFPALCALIYLLFGHHQALVVLLQIALNTATCTLVFFIAERFFDSKCAYLAAVLTALHPALIIYSSTMLHSITFYSFLLCASFFLLLVVLKNSALRYKILLGLTTGFCALERPTFLPFFILSWFWFFYYSVDKKEAKRVILISIVSLFLIVSPWIIRNTVILNKVVFIQTNQWVAFWLGNNPNSSGTALDPSGKRWLDTSSKEFRKKLFSLDEVGQMELFKRTSLSFVRQYPGQFVVRTLKKLYYFWWFSPEAGLLYPVLYLVLYKMYYIVILSGSIIGIIWALSIEKTRPPVILMLLLFGSTSLLHSLYYLEGRHRFGIEPFLLICFSFGAFQIWNIANADRVHKKT